MWLILIDGESASTAPVVGMKSTHAGVSKNMTHGIVKQSLDLFFPLNQLVSVCIHTKQTSSWLCMLLVFLNAYLPSQEILGIPFVCMKHFSWPHLLIFVAQNREKLYKYYADTEVGQLAQGDEQWRAQTEQPASLSASRLSGGVSHTLSQNSVA